MSRFLCTAILLLSISAGSQWAWAGDGFAPVSDTARLEQYVGKYPSELLKGDPDLKRRLRVLLGANFSFFMDRIETEMPIVNSEGSLVARGCKAHSCGDEEALFLVDLSNGKLYCAILSSRYGGKFKVFSEDPDHIPPALKHAMEH